MQCNIVYSSGYITKAHCSYLTYLVIPELRALGLRLGVIEPCDEICERELEIKIISKLTSICNGVYVPFGRLEIIYDVASDTFSFDHDPDRKMARALFNITISGDEKIPMVDKLLDILFEYRATPKDTPTFFKWVNVFGRRHMYSRIDKLVQVLVVFAFVLSTIPQQ